MPILVPVVASYPYKRGIMMNYKKCLELGHTVVLDPAILGPTPRSKSKNRLIDEEYGHPAKRAHTLLHMILNHANGEPCIVATATGGLGTIRMMSHWKNSYAYFHNAVVVGFSDSTALTVKAAANSRGMPSFHGPCFEDAEFPDALPYYQMDRNEWTEEVTVISGSGRRSFDGLVWGGNITLFGYMLSHPEVRGAMNGGGPAIIFLEDVYEDCLYKGANKKFLLEMELDRLEQAHIFQSTQMILLGRVSEIRRDIVIASIKKYYKGPIIGIDVGHGHGVQEARLLPVIPIGTPAKFKLADGKLSCRWKVPGKVWE